MITYVTTGTAEFTRSRKKAVFFSSPFYDHYYYLDSQQIYYLLSFTTFPVIKFQLTAAAGGKVEGRKYTYFKTSDF